MSTLKAVPRRWFSKDFEIFEGPRSVAVIDCALTRERASILLDGDVLEVGREGWFSGAYFLKRDGQLVASALKPSAFKRSFDVTVDGRRLTLAAASFLTSPFDLHEGRRLLGRFRPRSLFSRGLVVDLPSDLDLELEARVFLIWLVLMLWRRQEDSG